MSREKDKTLELYDRSCDALVLAYSPQIVLGRDKENTFYIPSSKEVGRAFGYSLRKILGKKEGGSHWTDSVYWGAIANLDKLEPRILEGTEKVLRGSKNTNSYFEGYYSSGILRNFGNLFIFGKGDLYRFLHGKRKPTLENFRAYWNEKEKGRWKDIHKFMREFTKKEFERKN